MKIRPLYTAALISLFLVLALSLSIEIYSKISPAEKAINQNIKHQFKEAVRINTERKNKDTPIFGEYNYNPKKRGTFENQTIRTADTTITFRCKIVDPETQLSNSKQIYLLMTDQLHSNDVKQVLDSLLNKEGITAKTVVAIRSTGYPTKNIELSEDTLLFSFKCKFNYTTDENIAQIHYTAFTNYPFSTTWRFMDKTILYIIGVFEFILGLMIFFAIMPIIKKRPLKHRKNEMPLDKTAFINNVSTNEIQLRIEHDNLLFNDSRVQISPQSKEILTLFLNAEDHRINKNDLREIWPPRSNRTNSMTSAIGRINKTIQKLDAPYLIETDKDDRSFYKLTQTIKE